MRSDTNAAGVPTPLAARRALAIAMAVVTVSASIPAYAAGEILKGPRFISVMKGNTISGRTEDGTKFNVYFLSGGRATYTDSKGVQDRGRWRMNEKDDKVCVAWDNHRDGKEACSIVTLDGRTIHGKSGGTERAGYIRGYIAQTFLDK